MMSSVGRLSAARVPLLRANVVVSARDEYGDAASLIDDDIDVSWRLAIQAFGTGGCSTTATGTTSAVNDAPRRPKKPPTQMGSFRPKQVPERAEQCRATNSATASDKNVIQWACE